MAPPLLLRTLLLAARGVVADAARYDARTGHGAAQGAMLERRPAPDRLSRPFSFSAGNGTGN